MRLPWRTFLVDLFWLPSRLYGAVLSGVWLGAALGSTKDVHARRYCAKKALLTMEEMREVYASRIRARRSDGAHKEARLLLDDYYEVVARSAKALDGDGE